MIGLTNLHILASVRHSRFLKQTASVLSVSNFNAVFSMIVGFNLMISPECNVFICVCVILSVLFVFFFCLCCLYFGDVYGMAWPNNR